MSADDVKAFYEESGLLVPAHDWIRFSNVSSCNRIVGSRSMTPNQAQVLDIICREFFYLSRNVWNGLYLSTQCQQTLRP